MKSKKTIVHIIPKFCFGGAERLVALYADIHTPELYDIHVIACVEDGDLHAQIKQTPANIFVASRKKYGGRWGAWKAMKQYLDSIDPDIIHTHLLTSDVLGYIYRLQSKQKPIWISTQHNVEDIRPWIQKKIWRFILPKADRVIAVAPRVYEYAHTKFAVPTSILRLALNGINTQKWLAASKTVPLQKHNIIIATIGRLDIQKGHTYALTALAQLDKGIPWEYHVYGSGVLESSLKEQANKLNIDDRIVWHGVVNDLEKRIQNIDIVLQPSLFEGLSLVILETMTAGRVVLTTPAGGEGVIETGKNGYIVPAKDAEAIANMLVHITKHTVEAQNAAHAAHDKAKKEFDIQQNIDKIEAVYSECFSNT